MASKAKQRALRWPQLPRVTHGAGGPIRVRLVKRPTGDHGEAAWGTWEQASRTIRIERSARPEHRQRVFYHEFAHSVLDDAGLCHLLTEEAQETLADAFASSMMAKLRGELAR